MAYIPVEFALVKGLFSSASLGNTAITDLPPQELDLLTGTFRVDDQQAGWGWSPNNPILKNDGIYADNPVMEGGDLLAGDVGNVDEVVELVAIANQSTALDRQISIATLNHYAVCARRYWTERNTDEMVYLKFWAQGAVGPQYVRIYDMQVKQGFDVLNVAQTGTVTLMIRRAPYFTPLPPGTNPKIWTLQSRNLKPSTVSGLAASTQYNHANLSLTEFGAVGSQYRHLVEATIYGYDESSIALHASSINYIDIPASALQCDAPVPFLLSVNPQSFGGLSEMHMALSTKRDLYPANTTILVDQKARNSFNAADSTVTTLAGGTNVKVIDATNGLRGGADGVNRLVVETTWGANTNSTNMSWQRRLNQYRGRYAVFVEYLPVSGTIANIEARVQVSAGVSGSYTTIIEGDWQTLVDYGARNLLYMGAYDLTQQDNRLAGVDGKGLDVVTNANVTLWYRKNVAAGTVGIKTVTVWFMPIDEGYFVVDFSPINGSIGNSTSEWGFYDNTGYFMSGQNQAAVLGTTGSGGGLRSAAPIGRPFMLKPRVDNRIWFMLRRLSAATSVASRIALDIMPRWAGVRAE